VSDEGRGCMERRQGEKVELDEEKGVVGGMKG
jgi:hypothetical protein